MPSLEHADAVLLLTEKRNNFRVFLDCMGDSVGKSGTCFAPLECKSLSQALNDSKPNFVSARNSWIIWTDFVIRVTVSNLVAVY